MARNDSGSHLTRLEAAGLVFSKVAADGELLYWCPFHDDRNRPDLRVSAEEAVWYCFPCGEGGTLAQLLRRLTWSGGAL